MKNRKVKILDSRVVFSCKYLSITKEDFVLGSKKAHTYYLINRKHYVIVLAKEGKYFYMVEQYRYPMDERLVQVVAGSIEKGETPLAAAKKELREEAGITAKKIKKIGWFYAYYGASKQIAHVFLAEGLKFGKQDLKGFEKEADMMVKKYTMREIRSMINSNKIRDEDTLSSFCMYMLKCERSFLEF